MQPRVKGNVVHDLFLLTHRDGWSKRGALRLPDPSFGKLGPHKPGPSDYLAIGVLVNI